MTLLEDLEEAAEPMNGLPGYLRDRLRAHAERLRKEFATADEGAARNDTCADFVLLPALRRINNGPIPR